MEVFIPLLMSAIVDGGLDRQEDFMLKSWFSPELIANRNRFVLTAGLIMVIIACISMAFGLLSARFSAISSQGFAKNLRFSILDKIQSFSFANTDRFTTSSLITRGTTDVNAVRNTMYQFQRTLARSPIMVIMASVMAFTVAPNLALIFLIAIPVLAFVLVILLKIGQPRFRRMLTKMDDMNSAVQENLVSSRVVKAYVRGDYESKRFEGTTEDLRQAQLAALYLFSAITNYALNRLMLEASTVIMRQPRTELFSKMQKLPISYFDANTHGSLMSYFTNDIDATNEHLQHSITQLLISVTSLIGTIGMMLALSMLTISAVKIEMERLPRPVYVLVSQ